MLNVFCFHFFGRFGFATGGRTLAISYHQYDGMTPRSSVMTVDADGEVRTTLVLWFQKPPTQQGRRQQDWQSKLVMLLPFQLLNHQLHGGLMGLQWIYMRDYYHREIFEDIVTN